ncbi:MAG: cytochrome c oxidase accessory protein CcoG [Planctomycetes bacterium]|nr:cytochrome c oxidase accessory protein CcoG [Planctomycetota bacterium]
MTTERRVPNLDSLYTINPDGSHRKIHPADVKGRFQRRKKILWGILIAIYLVVPWVKIGGNPAILIDIGRRQFFLLGNTYNAQDFYLAFFFVTGLAFSLYVISSLWGRLWCGYACPHTVFLEGVFRRIERWIEGSAGQRERLAKSGWGFEKVWRRGLKWAIYLGLSLILSHTFLSYFMPVEKVFEATVSPPSHNPTAFTFILVFTAIIYFNFTWFREQLCIVICPYGRLQSVLYDEHTVNVGYDRTRGEPRKHYKETDRGACIDCFRCVSVCPTGIDIRNGTQLECVGCANCVDACDDVMDKIGQPRGLIRYDSQAGFHGLKRRLLRPRTALYGVLLVIGLVVFLVMASGRTAFEARVLRVKGVPYTLDGDVVTNVYSLHLVNKLPHRAEFRIAQKPGSPVQLVIPAPAVTLDPFGAQRIPIIGRIQRAALKPGAKIEVTVVTGETHREIEEVFLGPN